MKYENNELSNLSQKLHNKCIYGRKCKNWNIVMLKPIQKKSLSL